MTSFYRRGVRLCIFPVPSTFLAQKPSRHIFQTFVLFIQSCSDGIYLSIPGSLDTFGMPWWVHFIPLMTLVRRIIPPFFFSNFWFVPLSLLFASVCPIFLSFFLPPHSLFRPPIVILLLFVTVFPSALLHNRQVRGTGMSWRQLSVAPGCLWVDRHGGLRNGSHWQGSETNHKMTSAFKTQPFFVFFVIRN